MIGLEANDVVETVALAITAQLNGLVSVDGDGNWTGDAGTISALRRPASYGSMPDPIDREVWLIQGDMEPEKPGDRFMDITGGIREVRQNWAAVIFLTPAETDAPATAIDQLLNRIAAIIEQRLRVKGANGVPAGWIAGTGAIDLLIHGRAHPRLTKCDDIAVHFSTAIHMLEDNPYQAV